MIIDLIRSIFIFFILISLSFSQKISKITRILLIGDSVDRYSIEDWCNSYKYNIIKGGDKILTNGTFPNTVFDYFGNYHERNRAWEIRICENHSKQVIIGFLFNKIGVKPSGPWWFPKQTMAGLNRTQLFDNKLTLNETIMITLFPAIINMEKILGGTPTGILISSGFWDLSHPDPNNLRINQPNEWLNSWKNNVTLFMNIIKFIFPTSCWFGWRSSNSFHPVREGIHWNTHNALNLLYKMNNISLNLSYTNGYNWIKFKKSSMRDHLHPNKLPLIHHIEKIVYIVQQNQNNLSCLS